MSLQPSNSDSVYEKDPLTTVIGPSYDAEQQLVKERDFNPYNIETLLTEVEPQLQEVVKRVDVSYKAACDIREYIDGSIPKIEPERKIIQGLANLFRESAEFDDLDGLISYTVDKYDIAINPALKKNVQGHLDYRDKIMQSSSQVSEAVENLIDEDSDKAYVVAKILGSHAAVAVKNPIHIIVKDYLILATELDYTDLANTLEFDIQEGEFDGHIARDLLYEHRRRTHQGSESAIDSPISKMVDMAKLLMGTDDEHLAIDFLSNSKVMETWQPESRKLFDKYKNDLAKGIASRREARLAYAYTSGALGRKCSEKELANLFRQMPEIKRGTNGGGKQTRAEIMMNRVNAGANKGRKKSSRPKKSIGRVAMSPNRDEAEAQLPLRKLQYVNSLGQVFNEDSDEFKDMIKAHIGERKGSASIDRIKNDITKILESLKRPTKSNGLVRGVNHLRGDSFISLAGSDDHSKLKVQRFQPSKAAGVPLSCKVSHSTRVLFVENDGIISIMGITDKKNIHRILRQFGLSTSIYSRG